MPDDVRVEVVEGDDGVPSRLVGGSLKTLLYMTQLAAISQDPWFSRVQSPDIADHVAIDLDPMPDATFPRVLDVARWVRDELAALGAVGYPKTSGADGLHIFIPLPAGTPYEAGLIYCQIVATMVATKHPQAATVERTVRARGSAMVYVDYLQNIQGKTLACAYSARASAYGRVHAAHVGRDRRRRRSPRLHDPHAPGAAAQGRRSLGTAPSIEGREPESRRAIRTVGGGGGGSRAVRRRAAGRV